MKRNAFTLIELMIVIVILGLLAAMVMPSIIGKGEEAKHNLVCVQMKSIYNGALAMYKLNHGVYPTTQQGLAALTKNNKYFKNNGGKIQLVSFGSDGKEGGKGTAADIKLSQCK